MGSIVKKRDALIRIVWRREMLGMPKSLAVSTAVLAHPQLLNIN